jgi:uncharacterized membrane protein YhhN
MDSRKRKIFLAGYLIFLIGLLLNYVFVPTESFITVLWFLLGIFLIFNVYLFFLKPTKN